MPGNDPKGNNENKPWRDEETLRRLYWDEGMSQFDIAEELGCSQMTVSNWMEKFDIEARDQESHTEGGRPWRDEETLREEYVEKKRSSEELAEEWNCSATTVRNWLKRFDIDIRQPADIVKEKPYHNEDILRELYIDEDMTQPEMAEQLGCDQATVSRWLQKHSLVEAKK